MRRAAALAAALALGGCYDLSSLSRCPDLAAPSGDGFAPAPDLAGNLIANGDFEFGTGPWTTGGGSGTASWTTKAHSGAHAVELCAAPGEGIGFSSEATSGILPGATYHGDAWVLLEPPWDVDGTLVLDDFAREPTTHATSRPDWQHVAVSFVPSQAAPGVYVILRIMAGATPLDGGQACMVVDDVYLTAS